MVPGSRGSSKSDYFNTYGARDLDILNGQAADERTALIELLKRGTGPPTKGTSVMIARTFSRVLVCAVRGL